MLFKQYMDLLEKLRCLEEDDIQEANAQAELLKEQLNSLLKEIHKLEQEALGENSPYIKSVIAKEASKIEQNYKVRLQELADRKRNIMQEEARNRADLLQSIQGEQGCEATLRTVYNVITQYKGVIDTTVISGLRVPIETHKELSARAVLFEKHYEKAKESGEPFCKRVAELASMKDVFSSMENPKVAVGCMTGYVLVSVIASLYLPILVILGYVGITCISVRDALRLKDTLSAIEKEFWLLEKSYQNLESAYSEEMRIKVDEANNQADKDLADAISGTAEEEQKLKEEYENLLQELQEMENNPEFRASTLSIFQQKLNGLRSEQQDYEEQLQEAEEELEDQFKDLEAMRDKLKELRDAIIEKYGGALKPGTNRLLAKNLFLGFESKGDIRLFPFNGESTVIFYSGESPDVTDLVIQLFVELLREVNIASLSFYIMDTKMGAPRFAPYTQEELSEVVTICSTKEQCSQSITAMHLELEDRNKTILAYASDIESFNTQMLEKNSLTKDYKILLIQESSGAILNNPMFEQILESGPAVGIVPIVFIQNTWYAEQLRGEGQDIEASYNLLKAIHQNWFQYIHEQDVMIQKDKAYINTNLKRLSQILLSKK